MRDSNRILFVTDTLGYGGAEKQMVFAAEGLSNRGFEVAILNLNQDKRAGESHVHRFPSPRHLDQPLLRHPLSHPLRHRGLDHPRLAHRLGGRDL